MLRIQCVSIVSGVFKNINYSIFSSPCRTILSLCSLQRLTDQISLQIQRCPIQQRHCISLTPRRWKQSDALLYPPLVDDELEEMFVRGSGPGGQSVNKTSNCVVLKHIPTGLTVKVHDTRSLITNREIARLRLQERLDHHWHGSESVLEIRRREGTDKRLRKEAKTKERLEKLRLFKEREGLD